MHVIKQNTHNQGIKTVAMKVLIQLPTRGLARKKAAGLQDLRMPRFRLRPV